MSSLYITLISLNALTSFLYYYSITTQINKYTDRLQNVENYLKFKLLKIENITFALEQKLFTLESKINKKEIDTLKLKESTEIFFNKFDNYLFNTYDNENQECCELECCDPKCCELES